MICRGALRSLAYVPQRPTPPTHRPRAQLLLRGHSSEAPPAQNAVAHAGVAAFLGLFAYAVYHKATRPDPDAVDRQKQADCQRQILLVAAAASSDLKTLDDLKGSGVSLVGCRRSVGPVVKAAEEGRIDDAKVMWMAMLELGLSAATIDEEDPEGRSPLAEAAAAGWLPQTQL